MKRFFTAIALLCLSITSLQAQTPQVPESLTTVLDQAVKSINGNDKAGQAAVAAGEPTTIFKWNYRPSMPGFGSFVQRIWKAGAIKPANTSEWLAVIWATQPAESQGDHVHRLVRQGDSWKIGAEIPETDPLGFRLRDHKIKVSFDLPTHIAHFTDDVAAERLRPDARDMQIRLSADFPLESLTCNGLAVPYSQVGGIIYANPPAGQKFTLHMLYSGTAYHPKMFVGNLVDPSEVVLTAFWYPVISRLPTTHGVTITVPKGWTAIGQGNETGRTDHADGTTFSFRMDVPTTYFTLDAGPYYRYEKRVNGRTYRCYLTKPDYQRGERQVEIMDASFRLFERLWGPYLWDNFTIVETGQPGWPGALEAYSFTTYGGGIVPGDNPHEWGHTWWGGFVPNTYLQDIWNETMATYSESVFYRYGKGPADAQAARNKVFWTRAFPSMERMVALLPLSESADSLYGPSNIVGYQKGGLVMQNLEEMIGFDLTQKCLRTLRDKFLYSGNAATWTDFEQIVRQVTGKDYKWWFDQWVRTKGLPSLKWENVSVKHNGGSYDVEADIVQVGQPYRLNVPVWLQTGTTEMVKTVQAVSGPKTHVHLSSSSAPTKLLLDPEVRLPRAVSGAEVAQPANMGSSALIITSVAGQKRANELMRDDRVLKLDTEVTDADLKGKNVILIGNAMSNSVWAKLARNAPFQATSKDITYHNKTHAGASGTAYTPNPIDPAFKMAWITENVAPTERTGFGGGSNPTSLVIYSSKGDMLDAELSLPQSGPSVYNFKK